MALDPGELVRELGAQPASTGSGAATATAHLLYCNSCWSVLPPAAVECPDCGCSVAEMEAERAAREETDRNWTPPHLLEEPGAADAEDTAPVDPDLTGELPAAGKDAGRRAHASRPALPAWLAPQVLARVALGI